jgi:hypothetical protein
MAGDAKEQRLTHAATVAVNQASQVKDLPMFRFYHRPTNTRSKKAFHPCADSLEGRTVLSTAVNAQVLAYVKAHINQVVGDGECATLARSAIQYAGGVSFDKLGPTGLNADYVWGKYVTTLTPTNGNTAAIQPGDVLQFRNVTEVDTMVVHFKNGGTSTTVTTQNPSHHTAIVDVIGGNAPNDIQVYQANVKLWDNESWQMQHEDQWGIVFGGTGTRTFNYQDGSSITVTHTMTSGVINVYRPYK